MYGHWKLCVRTFVRCINDLTNCNPIPRLEPVTTMTALLSVFRRAAFSWWLLSSDFNIVISGNMGVPFVPGGSGGWNVVDALPVTDVLYNTNFDCRLEGNCFVCTVNDNDEDRTCSHRFDRVLWKVGDARPRTPSFTKRLVGKPPKLITKWYLMLITKTRSDTLVSAPLFFRTIVCCRMHTGASYQFWMSCHRDQFENVCSVAIIARKEWVYLGVASDCDFLAFDWRIWRIKYFYSRINFKIHTWMEYHLKPVGVFRGKPCLLLDTCLFARDESCDTTTQQHNNTTT